MALDDSTKRALPYLQVMYHPYEVRPWARENGMSDVTAYWHNGDVMRDIEVKGRDKSIVKDGIDWVLWNCPSFGKYRFKFDNAPAKDATHESYLNGDAIHSIPQCLDGRKHLYILNADDRKEGFMYKYDEEHLCCKWMKVRDYGYDLMVIANDCYWYVPNKTVKERFLGYSVRWMKDTFSPDLNYGEGVYRDCILALFDFDGLPYTLIEDQPLAIGKK